MGNHIVYITISRRVRQSNSRYYRSAESKSRQIGKVNNRTADSASDTATNQRILKPHIHTKQGRLRNSKKH